MSWTCAHQSQDDFCMLQNKECKPGFSGCVLANKFKFIAYDSDPEADKNIKKRKRNKL